MRTPSLSTLEHRHIFGRFIANSENEAECRMRLEKYLARVGQVPVDRNVHELFSLESGVADRFNYFADRMPESARRRLLVSGCAAGSEMIIARDYGFQEIVGTEVVQEYVEITHRRLMGHAGFHVISYD